MKNSFRASMKVAAKLRILGMKSLCMAYRLEAKNSISAYLGYNENEQDEIFDYYQSYEGRILSDRC